MGPSPKPFQRVSTTSDIYESEIESLFWDDLESFTGEPLFAVGRQAKISGGGIPDIVALDSAGRVVVIEIKRNVDRTQLSQCLEYAGWARQASLDELAGIYHSGEAAFFSDWREFTGTESPMVLNRLPRLVLVARSFHGRTESALHFLTDNGVPVKVITVVFYEDSAGARIADVNNGADTLVSTSPPDPSKPDMLATGGVRAKAYIGVTLTDLLEANLIHPGELIEWIRPQVGEHHRARIEPGGLVVVESGGSYASLSMAADSLSGGSHNGWDVWKAPRLGGLRMTELRQQFLKTAAE